MSVTTSRVWWSVRLAAADAGSKTSTAGARAIGACDREKSKSTRVRHSTRHAAAIRSKVGGGRQ